MGEELRQYSLDFKEADHIEQCIGDADVILVEPVVQPDYTKSRDERGKEVGMTPANYKITRELLGNKAKSDAILLHSLPRMDEIPTDVDITRWFYFGGTSLLIVVGVALDTVQQVESHLLMRHYEGFLKKARVRGRSA